MPHDGNGKNKTLYNKRIQKYQLVYIADTKRPKRMCETLVKYIINQAK